MTIGTDSRKSYMRGSIRAPKFLDKSSGFYGRLDEPESALLEAKKGTLDENDEALPHGRRRGSSKRRRSGRREKTSLDTVIHRDDADDQVLIRDKRMKAEQSEVMKVVKRNTLKTYRKAVDRAFRRGWEAFVANIYSVTLTPVASSKKKHQHNIALAEFQ